MLGSILPGIFPLEAPGALLAAMALSITFSFALQRFKFFKNAGIVFTVVLVCIAVSNIGFVPSWSDTYDAVFAYTIPLSIALMLLEVDIRSILKLSRQPLMAMAAAIVSITVVTFLLGLIFVPGIEEGWKLAGMFIGTYTGGSPNLTAIGVALNASADAIAAANAADYIGCMPALIILFALPPILKRSKWFNKVWPYAISDEELSSGKDTKIAGDLTWSIVDISKLLAIGFSIMVVSQFLAGFFPESFYSAAEVLLITTISLCVAQIKQVREIKGSMDLGMLFALWFLTVIGFMVDIREFFGSALYVAVFVILILIITTLLHMAICRLLKIPYQHVVVSIMAAIWDGPSAALLAISAEWKSLVSIGIVLGTIGHAVGNYLGIMVAYLLKSVLNL